MAEIGVVKAPSPGGLALAQRLFAKLHRRRGGRTLAAVGVLLLGGLWRFGLHWFREQTDIIRRRSHVTKDPTFGKAIGIVYREMDRQKTEYWETFLDGLKVPANSPMRLHVAQLFGRADLTEQLETLFGVLCQECDGVLRLLRSDLERFSQGLKGELHVLLQSKQRMPLHTATAEDQQWMLDKFDTVYTVERPLDQERFVSLAKLIIVRRVVRTLISGFGIQILQRGLSDPVVIDIVVELGWNQEPFHIHTVAPRSSPALSGDRLSVISES